MKAKVLCSLALLAAGSLLAADSSPKDEVIAAAKKLAEKDNYSWKTTVVVPADAKFKPGPSEGQTEKDGFTHVKMSFGEATTQVVVKGEKFAATTPDGDWQSGSELANSEGPGRFLGRMMRTFKAPAGQAEELAKAAKDLKPDGDAIAGDLTEEGAKSQFRIGNVTNPKGSVKFWIKDGLLSKLEFKIQGQLEFNGNEMDVDRDTTIEIKEVGTTKVAVPDEAKKKLT